jgi:hypothetical protein
MNCEGCPCMSTDYEHGSSCNLGYDCQLRWFDKKNGNETADTADMRRHQNDFVLRYSSTNCDLVEVKTTGEVIKPQTIIYSLKRKTN